jgi:hypothetical protein
MCFQSDPLVIFLVQVYISSSHLIHYNVTLFSIRRIPVRQVQWKQDALYCTRHYNCWIDRDTFCESFMDVSRCSSSNCAFLSDFNEISSSKLLRNNIMSIITKCTTLPFDISQVLMATIGLSMGFLDTGGNVSIIWLHGESVGPYMQVQLQVKVITAHEFQSLHLAFGIGAFFSPMIVGEVMDIAEDDPSWGFWIIAILTFPICIWLLILKPVKRTEQEKAQTSVGAKEIVCPFVLISFHSYIIVTVHFMKSL